MNDASVVSLYVVVNSSGKYFAGFDSSKGMANFIDSPKLAKKFTNKYDIKLRPDEQLVELRVDLAVTAVSMSEPFRPSRRKQH
jgi:hypothetical protein